VSEHSRQSPDDTGGHAIGSETHPGGVRRDGASGAPAISVVVPVRDESENVGPLVAEIAKALAGNSYEMLFVDDGSVDGTGDVLAGVIGGLLAQGLPALEAATLGTFLHGAAADGLAGRLGDAGLLASELADALPETARRLAERAAAAPGPGLAIPFPEP